jgi:capsular exopolysaccharide synthesis family protein
MALLNGSSGGDQLVPYDESELLIEHAPHSYPGQSTAAAEAGGARLNLGLLLRKYWLLAVAFLILGAAGGFASVVLTSPTYRARLLLEVQNSVVLTRNGLSAESSDSSDITIQTQISILRSGTFLQRGSDRMTQDAVLPAPPGRDIFSRLRQRIRAGTQDPVENARRGLSVALATFEAREMTRTRLIELSCESSSPDIAAQFLNAMGQEYMDYTARSKMQTAQRTNEWLAQSIEETKTKMQEADERVRDFSLASGNIFAGQDATLEDTKLSSLKSDLARSQADAIAKRTRYELTLKYPPEALGEVLDDGTLRGYQQKINALKETRAALEVRFTAKHQKVRELDAQLASVERDYQNEIHSIVSRIKQDYEAANQQQQLLNQAYNTQSQRVGAQLGKVSQYNALKRDSDTLHSVYQSLLMQQSEAGLNASVPGNSIQIVESATPPAFPYKPQPGTNILFGCLIGLALAGGFVFLRERMDQSIRTPGASRRLLNVPELGVIPNLVNGYTVNGQGTAGRSNRLALSDGNNEVATALLGWQSRPSFVTESFRGTLTSILRNQTNGRPRKTILITSPGPSEGKTTVVQNLGIALAETGRRVLLVDADFRRPHLHCKFGLPNEWGIANLLSEQTELSHYKTDQLGVPTAFPGLSLLANGLELENVSRALYSPRLREVFQILTKHYDMVLVDVPPILHVADTRIVAPLTDALILVLRSGVTDRASAMEAYQRIQEDGLPLLGTVLTDCDLSSDRKKQYYYDYGDPRRA